VLVTWLLDSTLDRINKTIGSRLAAALAACAHLSSLGAPQRMWSLQTLRTLMTSGYGLSLNIPALVATSEQQVQYFRAYGDSNIFNYLSVKKKANN